MNHKNVQKLVTRVCAAGLCVAGAALSSCFRCSILLVFPSMLGSRGRSYLMILVLSVLFQGKQTNKQTNKSFCRKTPFIYMQFFCDFFKSGYRKSRLRKDNNSGLSDDVNVIHLHRQNKEKSSKLLFCTFKKFQGVKRSYSFGVGRIFYCFDILV
uniref:DC-STAMP domain containing 1 n=1 Tax=Oryzias latipes TaxID=8090 RepID=A0A3B3HZR8_ORYLA